MGDPKFATTRLIDWFTMQAIHRLLLAIFLLSGAVRAAAEEFCPPDFVDSYGEMPADIPAPFDSAYEEPPVFTPADFPAARVTFHVPRTRPYDFEEQRYLGGPPVIGRCGRWWPSRMAAWSCYLPYERPPIPVWTVQADALFMRREVDDPIPLLFDTVSGDTVLDASQLVYEMEPGPRISAKFAPWENYSVDGSFFALKEWRPLVISDAANAIIFDGAGLGLAGPISTDPFATTIRSRLQSGEINLRRDYWGRYSLFGGMRWVEFEDELTVQVTTTNTPFLLATNNSMVGLQLGAECKTWVNYGILRIDGVVKGGIYDNRQRLDSSYLLDAAAAQQHHATWVGEAQAFAVLPMSKHCYLRLGFEAMHMAGIAKATDQLDFVDLPGGTATIDTKGDAIFLGFSIGLEAWW